MCINVPKTEDIPNLKSSNCRPASSSKQPALLLFQHQSHLIQVRIDLNSFLLKASIIQPLCQI